jgi:hypothetical protein
VSGGGVEVTPDGLREAARAAGDIAGDLRSTDRFSAERAQAAAAGLRGWQTADTLRYVAETWAHQVDSLHAALTAGQAKLTHAAANYENGEKTVVDGMNGLGG